MARHFSKIRALAFDHYGTLFDKQAISALIEEAFPGNGAEAARLWYDTTKQYCFLSGMMERHVTWAELTRRSLTYVGNALDLQVTEDLHDRLLEADLTLPPYPDAPTALERLAEKLKLYVLSMGSPHMIEASQRHAGVDHLFTAILSTEPHQVYKPSPAAYQVGVDGIGLDKSAIGFVSSNSFDVMGAANFGFPTFWVNRAGVALDEIGPRPDLEVSDLHGLADALLD